MESELTIKSQESFQSMQQKGSFDIAPCENMLNLDDSSRFTRLDISPEQRSQISILMQSAPMVAITGEIANAYTVSFPEGLPHTLTALKQGGVGSMISTEEGFVGSASFYQMSSQAAVLSAFTAMSVVTGQYFMAQINSELKMINMKMDKILEFLYGDKKAELMSEISFVKYAYQNFSSLMGHTEQRIATISSLQQAKKVAMKDIEFYLGDLDSKSASEAKAYAQLEQIIRDSFQIRESLELSMQLYIMSSLLETQFAQNMDKPYISYVETETMSYIDKCDKRILSSFSSLKGRLDGYKAKPMEKVDKAPHEKSISALIESLNGGEESAVRKTIRATLHAPEKKTQYYVKKDGNVYMMKTA